jgi:phage tail protein X
MSTPYTFEVFDCPGRQWTQAAITEFQEELRGLGAQCLSLLPEYQVFERSEGALDDKLIACARKDGKVVGFVSAVWLSITGLADPVLHTGLTIVHPDHQQTGLVINLLAALSPYTLGKYPKGLWVTTLAEVISSLVRVTLFATQTFPSPQWIRENPSGKPSPTHLLIALEISLKHRDKMLISPDAVFEECTFVFRGSNASAQGSVFNKDIEDQRYWHRDEKRSRYYKSLMRRNAGDEVLQISFVEPAHLMQALRSSRPAARKSANVSSPKARTDVQWHSEN